LYKKVLVTLDGSKLSETALPHAETVARGCKQPQVILLRVVEPVAVPYGEAATGISFEQIKAAEAAEKKKAGKYLEKMAARFTAQGIKTSAKILTGNASEAIVDFIDKNNIDLVILATHGRSGVSRWIWGSVADRVLRHVCIPVLMARAPGCGLLYKK